MKPWLFLTQSLYDRERWPWGVVIADKALPVLITLPLYWSQLCPKKLLIRLIGGHTDGDRGACRQTGLIVAGRALRGFQSDVCYCPGFLGLVQEQRVVRDRGWANRDRCIELISTPEPNSGDSTIVPGQWHREIVPPFVQILDGLPIVANTQLEAGQRVVNITIVAGDHNNTATANDQLTFWSNFENYARHFGIDRQCSTAASSVNGHWRLKWMSIQL